ncbi:RICIN domain-containing protein [Cryptosporangium minutisporangium]|uniref:Ricin B lectin domain-containing protein n=1 Tax=Cryptosporangium minutisporangium TaxID=113569 RepID=A0ABP6TB12_9ACTN
MILGVAVSGSAATAEAVPEPTFAGYLVNQADSRCLTRTVPTSPHATKAQLAPCLYDRTQVWSESATVATPKGGGEPYFRLTDYLGTCLTANGSGRVTARRCEDPANPVREPENDWIRVPVSPGVYRLLNRRSGTVLAADPTHPSQVRVAAASDGDPSQLWHLLPHDAI